MLSLISRIDTSVLMTVFAHRDTTLVDFFSYITSYGNAITIFVLVIALVLAHIIKERGAEIVGLLTTIVGTVFTTTTLKFIFERPRPSFPYPAIHEVGYSLPSSHAALSLAFYGYLIWHLAHSKVHTFIRLPLIATLSLLIVLIGYSRIYLGVHYLSDVLLGYVVGGVFLYVGIRVTERLTHKLKKLRATSRN